jgi:hypothetical protein
MITGGLSWADDGEDEFFEAENGISIFQIGFGEVENGNVTPKMNPSLWESGCDEGLFGGNEWENVNKNLVW